MRQILRFGATYLALPGLDWAALQALGGLGLRPLTAQAVLTAPVAAVSFRCQKTLVVRLDRPAS